MWSILDPQRVSATRLRSLLLGGGLVGGMLSVMLACAWFLAGAAGVVMAIAATGVAALTAPAVSPALIMRWHRARPLQASQAPALHRALADVAARAGLPAVPALYVLRQPAINAFTVGPRTDAAIALSEGALRGLTPSELTAVLAHEVAHVAHGDTGLLRFSAIVAHATSMAAFLGLLGCFLLALTASQPPVPLWLTLLFALSPMTISLLQLGLSRNREFAADLRAASLMGQPFDLVSALESIDRQQRRALPTLMRAVPEHGLWRLLRSHPTLAERRRHLLEQIDRDHLRPDRLGPWGARSSGWPALPAARS